ncbi:glycosyltransferase [Arthrobacter frigidicola]|nr:glycosyltransferase [Arthrobacter frigidicola]
MRLLYVTESVPTRDPEHGDGSSMISWEVIRNLPAQVSVTLLTFEGPVGVADEVRQRCEAVHVLPTRRHLAAAVSSVLSLHDVGTMERTTRAAAATAARLSSRCDVSLVHGPHVLFLARHLRGPMVLQTVDPWSVRVGMESAMTQGWKTGYRSMKSRLLLRSERRIPPRARLLTVAPRDAAEWSDRLGREVRSIPNGVATHLRAARRREHPVVCFVGSLNYGPNISSVEILIQQIAPMVWREVPQAAFLIAGRRPVPAVMSLAGPRVEVRANVADVASVFEEADVAVFPDEHGVGIRNSVQEALAAGLPVVATPVAARGQEVHPLLTVEEDLECFSREVASRLTVNRRARGLEGNNAALRSWGDVANDYLGELETALHEISGRLQQEGRSF